MMKEVKQNCLQVYGVGSQKSVIRKRAALRTKKKRKEKGEENGSSQQQREDRKLNSLFV